MGRADRLRRLATDETGAAETTTIVFLVPVLTLLLFAAFQAALWNHARAQARAQARATAGLVARSGADPSDAEADAAHNLAARTDLHDVDVQVRTDGASVVVVVTGQAPGILLGTSSHVAVQVAMPIEGWSQL